MRKPWFGTHIISMEDLTREDLDRIHMVTEELRSDFLRRNFSKWDNLLSKYNVASAFFENSSRTRLSHRLAANYLGVDNSDGFYGPEGTSLQKGESLHDTIRMLIGYGNNIIVMRHASEGSARWAADVVEIALRDDLEKLGIDRSPVVIVNGGSGAEQHPTQVILDSYVIRMRRGTIDGLNIGFFGDIKNSRVANSWFSAMRLLKDSTLHLGFPEGFGPDHDTFGRLKDRGIHVETYDSLDGLKNVDVLIQLRPQLERMNDLEQKMFTTEWSITPDVVNAFVRNDAMILHPLPRNKNNLELAMGVDRMPQSFYFQQESLGPFTRAATFALICSEYGKTQFREGSNEKLDFSILGKLVERIRDEASPDERRRKVGLIEGNGVVIDHIPAGDAMKLVQLLKISKFPVYIGSNLPSHQSMGSKDLLKYDGLGNLDPDSLARIRLFVPDATINYIKGGAVAQKFRYELPERIGDVVNCANPRCTTSHDQNEHVPQKFYVVNSVTPELRCAYCDRITRPTKRQPMPTRVK